MERKTWAIIILAALVLLLLAGWWWMRSGQFYWKLWEAKKSKAEDWVNHGFCNQSRADKEIECYAKALVKKFGIQDAIDILNNVSSVSNSELQPMRSECIIKCRQNSS